MATSIFLIIGMQIRLTRLLEVYFINAKYKLEERLCEEYTGADCGYKDEIKKAMASDNNKNNDK